MNNAFAKQSAFSSRALLAFAGVLAVAGLVLLGPTWILLWWHWTTDPLRSIGMVFFPVAIVLLLLEWRRGGWERNGTWWGLLPIVFAILCNRYWVAKGELFVHWKISFNVLPVSLTPYAYVSGLVLLFAGVALWKRAWFPLLLLLLLNPLPTSIVPVIDAHLQVFAAHVTRVFANAIGFHPSTPQLLLMFSPNFGMFIAPGCDGMRGGVTFGYMALIMGYIRRLPGRTWALFTLAAVAIGYLLNLARLCLLVVYYRIAMGHVRLENSAKNADYIIGGCLMLLAAYTFFVYFLQAKQ
ncbi:MAG: exosortase J, partial [Acidobacteriaceae bacterium]